MSEGRRSFIVSLLPEVIFYFPNIQNNIENIQKSEQELNMIQQLMYHQQEQYRISQENIELIDKKCHDLRYQMEALRKLKDEQEIDTQLQELERSVMIYDSIIKTGNPVLDTVLTEKSLICEANQINVICMADGEKMDLKGEIPASTKQDKNYHGFGLKSIQYTAEKYGGGVVCQNLEHYFVLQILLPIPGC